jgi:hypothetical protein
LAVAAAQLLPREADMYNINREREREIDREREEGRERERERSHAWNAKTDTFVCIAMRFQER